MLLWTLSCMYLFILVFLLLSYIYPRLEPLGHIIVLFLVSWDTSILFSILAVPIYIPIKRVGGFPLLHILVNICYLDSFEWEPFWQVWGDFSLWFWFAFPWYLAILSIFSFACWPSAFSLWKNVYSGLLPIFKLGCLSFFFFPELYELVYILDINTLSVISFENVFSHWIPTLIQVPGKRRPRINNIEVMI